MNDIPREVFEGARRARESLDMGTRRHHRRQQMARLGIESLEGRELLTGAVLPSSSNVLIAQVTPLPSPPTLSKPADPNPAADGADPNLNKNLNSIALSPVYKTLGTSYIRRVFSGDTYAVTRSYKHALYTFNFREIRQINRSHYLKVVGDQFTQPVHSAGFKNFSRHLDLFGRAIEHRYHRVLKALA